MRRPSVLPVLPVLLGAVLAAVAAAPAAAVPVSDEEAMRIVAAERMEIGLQGFSSFDPQLAEGCRRHGVYQSLNADHSSHAHDELEGRPGYTTEGRDAARRSNLTSTDSGWSADPPRDPFAFSAPWHQMSLLSPYAGSSFWRGTDAGFDCMGTGTGSTYVVPPLDRLWLYPAAGAGVVPTGQDMSREGPYPPTRVLGLADDHITGPNIYVFGAAGLTRCSPPVVDAQLVGPDGAVALLVVDNHRRGPNGERPLLRGGLLVLPERPLRPASRYDFRVTVRREQRECTHGDMTTSDSAIGPVSAATHFTTAAAPAPGAGAGGTGAGTPGPGAPPAPSAPAPAFAPVTTGGPAPPPAHPRAAPAARPAPRGVLGDTPARQRLAAVLRRGVLVAVTAPRTGAVEVRLVAGRRARAQLGVRRATLARRAGPVRAGRTIATVLRLPRAAVRRLRTARRPVVVTVVVSGAATARRRVTLAP